MRKLIPIFFLLIWAQSARAQNFTTVTASNIQDVSGAKLASGMLCFDATNATNASNDTPSNEISFQAGGGGQVIRGPICTPVTNGAIGTFQVPNSSNTIPPGVAYHVYVVRGFYHVLDYYGVQVTGSTWNFDNYNPNSPTPAPPTGASVNGPLTVNGNLSVTGILSLSPQTSLTLGSVTIGSNPNIWIGQDNGVGNILFRSNALVPGKDAWLFSVPDLSTSNPVVVMFGGTTLGANPTLKINGSLQLTALLALGSITIGSNPNIWIGQDGGVGNIMFRTNQGTKDTWLFSVPDLSTANPVVKMFGGTQLGANPTLAINGALQVASIGNGSSSIALTSSVTGFQDKGGQVYNVKAYGAKGDGITDDTSAINAALAAANGGPVYMPPGTYLVTSTINVGSDSEIIGPGAVLYSTSPITILRFNGMNSHVLLHRVLTSVSSPSTDCVVFSPSTTGDSSGNEFEAISVGPCSHANIWFLPNSNGNVLNNYVHVEKVDLSTVSSYGVLYGSATGKMDEGNHVFSSLTIGSGTPVQFGDNIYSDVSWNTYFGDAHNTNTSTGLPSIVFNNSSNNAVRGAQFRDVGAARVLSENGASNNIVFSLNPDTNNSGWLSGSGVAIVSPPLISANGNLSATGGLFVGSNPNFFIGQDGGVGNIMMRTNGIIKDTWLFNIPDLSAANPVVTMFGGTQLGANPSLKIQGALNVVNPPIIVNSSTSTCDRYDFGSGDASGKTAIGANCGVTVAGVSDTSMFIANVGGPFHLTIDNSGNVGIQGTIKLGTPLAVQYGGTGTSNPSLIAGTGISISGTWPNQTISANGLATSIQATATSTTWAGIANTTLVSTTQNTGGVWTINVFSEVTAAGAGCTTGDGQTNMSVTISYTDANTNSAVNVTSLATLNLSSGNGTVGTNGTGTAIIYPKSGTAISYSTTVSLNSTCTTHPQYMIALQAIH